MDLAHTTHYTIYTDGACSGNPGPGGYAAIVIGPDGEYVVDGSDQHTTNNRMELQAAVSGLASITHASHVDLYTDSVYLQQGMSSWVTAWQKKGWRTATNQAVKNRDLWELLIALAKRHQVTWHWVKGHGQNKGNIRADELARSALKSARG